VGALFPCPLPAYALELNRGLLEMIFSSLCRANDVKDK